MSTGDHYVFVVLILDKSRFTELFICVHTRTCLFYLLTQNRMNEKGFHMMLG